MRPDADLHHLVRQRPQRAQHAFDGANTRRLVLLDHRIAGDPALTGMNDARLGAFAAAYLRRTRAARSRCRSGRRGSHRAGLCRCSEQRPAAARRAAPGSFAIDRNLVTSCHCLVPEGFKFSICGRCGRCCRAVPGTRQQAKRSRSSAPSREPSGMQGTALRPGAISIMRPARVAAASRRRPQIMPLGSVPNMCGHTVTMRR